MEKETEFAITCETNTREGERFLIPQLNRNFRETDDGELGLNYWPAQDVESSLAALVALRAVDKPRFEVIISEPREHSGTTLIISVLIREI